MRRLGRGCLPFFDLNDGTGKLGLLRKLSSRHRNLLE
jgi:hypothetical protein